MNPTRASLSFLAVGLALFTLVPSPSIGAIPGFARVTYPTPLSPTALATPDLNGNGVPDLAVGCQSDPNPAVSVFLGNGDGTLGARSDNATGLNPVNLAAGDFNGDGRLDLAATIHISNTIAILLGRGDGSFARDVEYPVGTQPLGIAAADFNEDGKTDLATVDTGDRTVSILLGNGNGTFQARRVIAVGSDPDGLASADLNRDGHQDLVVLDAGGTGSIITLLGRGDATFTSVTTSIVQGRVFAATLADFNADGILDIAVVNPNTGTFSSFLGVGDGSFTSQRNVPTAPGPISITAVDLDSDGKIDLAVSCHDGGRVSLFSGAGDGSFQNALDLTGFSNPNSVASTDWNGDGRPDLVVADEGANTAVVLLSLAGDLPARGFVAGNDKTIKLGTNTPWCAQAEPIGGDFALSTITPGSIELVSPGTGTVSRISASGATTTGDRDQNGVQDITACFDKTSLRALFSSIHGKQSVVVRVALEGALTGGRRFHAPFNVTVAPAGGMMVAALVIPSRDRSSGTLEFVTARSGAVSFSLYDVSGRLVARVLDRTWLPAGDHAVPFRGSGMDHAALASGVYLYRIETADGVVSGRTLVVK